MSSIELVMPKLGLTMEEGTISQWLRAVGEPFAAGDVIAVIETDKIASDLEAPSDGVLAEILVSEGDTVAVGVAIALLGGQGDAIKPARAEPSRAEPAIPVLEADPKPTLAPSPLLSEPTSSERVIATPYARKLATERDIDLRSVTATRPSGRIHAADVLAWSEHDPLVSRNTNEEPRLSTGAAQVTSTISRIFDVGRLRALEERILSETSRSNAPVSPLMMMQAMLRAMTDCLVLDASPKSVSLYLMGSDGFREIGSADLGGDLVDLRRMRQAASEGDVGGLPSNLDAPVQIIAVADPLIRSYSPAIKGAQLLSIGIGGSSSVFRPDDAGAPMLCHELVVTVTFQEIAISPITVLEIFERVAAFLVEPLLLLA